MIKAPAHPYIGMEGVYYELIAFICGRGHSSPVGVFGMERGTFRLYKGTRTSELMRGAEKIFLLSPSDPLLYYKSLRHELEAEVAWDGGCPRPDERLGAWYACSPRLVEEREEYDVYECEKMIHVAGTPSPYSRTTGCLVELLVLLSKVKAGVSMGDYACYARWLRRCVERSSRGNKKYLEVADAVLRDLGVAPE